MLAGLKCVSHSPRYLAAPRAVAVCGSSCEKSGWAVTYVVVCLTRTPESPMPTITRLGLDGLLGA